MSKRAQIIESLKDLKENHGVVAIKAEFEAEGSRKDELIMLREFIYQSDLELVIKIGGCEAVHDLDQCKLLDANGVMAPMIETPFAMSKFKGAAEKVFGQEMDRVDWIINAETKTCMENFEEILQMGDGFLFGVTIGRSDLSASMGITRSNIECDEVFNATYKLACQAKEHGLVANFGGNIGVESIPFVMRMADKIDRYETRKVILTPSDDPEKMKDAIQAALAFELLYLEFKSEYYGSMADEDAKRIVRLRKQIEQ